MQRSLITLGISAGLCTISGCALNDIFQSNPPAPPQAEVITATAQPTQPVLAEDVTTMPPAEVSSQTHAPQNNALEMQSIDIRGQTVAPALEDNSTLGATSDSEVLLGSISTPQPDNVTVENADTPLRPQGAGDLLPTYASGSNAGGSCDFALGTAATQQASQMAAALAGKLKVDAGEVYIAPTIIPHAYLDCIDDLSPVIASAVAQSSALQVIAADTAQQVRQTISQNSGSAAIMPLTIRTLRAAGIPYVVMSNIRPLDDGCALTLRFVRVSDGITLTQSFKKLNIPQTVAK